MFICINGPPHPEKVRRNSVSSSACIHAIVASGALFSVGRLKQEDGHTTGNVPYSRSRNKQNLQVNRKWHLTKMELNEFAYYFIEFQYKRMMHVRTYEVE